MGTFLNCLLILIAIKALTFGDFNLYYWHKYGNKYSQWYERRETFKDYLRKNK